MLITASNVHADNDLFVKAEKGDIIAMAAQDTLYYKTKEKKSKVNGLGGTLALGSLLLPAESAFLAPIAGAVGTDITLAQSVTKNTESLGISSVGSFLTAGNNISLDAGRDIGIIGSAVAADNDITLQAGRDVNLVPGREGFYSKSTKTKGTLGLSSSRISLDGATTFAGLKVEKSGITHAGEYSSGSLVNAGNDVTIIAGRDVNQVSSHVAAGRDVYVEAGQDWVVAAAHDVENLHQWVKEIETGVTASVRQNVTGAAKTVVKMPGNATKGQGGAGYSLVTAGSAGLRAIDSVNGAMSESAAASATVGANYNEHTYRANSSTAVSSSVSAGRDVIAFADRDITLEGARVNAGRDVILDAGRDVNILAATNDSSSSFSSGGGGGGVGLKAAYGSGGAAFGINVSANAHGAEGKGSGQKHTNSIVTAGDTLYIASGRDTNVKGAHLEGDKVWIDAGRDLNVASLQDSHDYNNSSWNAGIDVTVGYGVHVGGSFGVGQGSSSSQWVGQQTSIVGKSEVDIYVGGNTDIKGGLIYADNGNLKLDTGTISYEAVNDKNKSSDWSFGLSGGAGTGEQGDVNYSPPVVEGTYASLDQRQINRPTIGEGEITVRDDPDASLEGLNRDITKAQEITKNEKKSVDIYVSKGAIETFVAGVTTLVEKIDIAATDPKEYVDKKLEEKKNAQREKLIAEGYTPEDADRALAENCYTLRVLAGVDVLRDFYGENIPAEAITVVNNVLDTLKIAQAGSAYKADGSDPYDFASMGFIQGGLELIGGGAAGALDYLDGMVHYMLLGTGLGDPVKAAAYTRTSYEIQKALAQAAYTLATKDVIAIGTDYVDDIKERFESAAEKSSALSLQGDYEGAARLLAQQSGEISVKLGLDVAAITTILKAPGGATLVKGIQAGDTSAISAAKEIVAAKNYGSIQSRINLMNGNTKTGWLHVVKEHFSGKSNKSQFTLTQTEVRQLLQSDAVVKSPIIGELASTQGPRFVREVDMGRVVGVDKFTSANTTIMTVFTDARGNLVTAFPGVIP
ncbi:MAG: hypothetical protein DELT_00769 [Desulfovibrio sp.]